LIATFSNVSSPIAQAFVYHASEVLQQNVQLTGTPQMKTTETCT